MSLSFFKKIKSLFFRDDKFLTINYLISFIFNILLWGFLFYRIRPSESSLVLHYNIYFGIDLIGKWYKIFYLPLSGLIIFFINFILSYIIYEKEKIISYFLAGIVTLIQFFLIIALIFIILQNI